MAVSFLQCVLTAHRPGGTVTRAELLVALDAEPGGVVVEAVADRPVGATGKIVFEPQRLDAFAGVDRHAEFEGAVQSLLHSVGAWLLPRAPAVRRLRAAGVDVQLLVELWMDQNQVDLRLPVPLLLALAAAGIEVYILSNE